MNQQYANLVPGTPDPAVARDLPAFHVTASTIANEAAAINNRLEAMLNRNRTPGPRALDNGRAGESGPSPVPTLQSTLHYAETAQKRTHELLTELESLL